MSTLAKIFLGYTIKIFKHLIVIFSINFFFNLTHASENLIPFKMGILGSFNVVDSIYSERYKNAFMSSIYYAVGENDEKLKKCGYRFQIMPEFFNSSRILSAKESALELEESGVWMILGPVRGEQFLVSLNGLKSTPMISLMAGSNKIINMKTPYFTVSPGVKEFAKAASFAVKKEKLGSTYGVFVDAACSECKDFEDEFTKINEKKLTKVFSIDGAGEKPSINNILIELKTKKIDFLLLPNYSKFAGHVISQLHLIYPDIKFLGSDGWGQTSWSFLPGYALPSDVFGVSVRVGFSNEDMETYYNVYSLDVTWKNQYLKPPYLSYATVELIRKITEDLCTLKPKDKTAFLEYITHLDKSHYQTKTPIGVYKLKDGVLKYSYPIKTT